VTRGQAAALLLLVVPLLWGLLWWGWRGRVRRTRLAQAPPAVPTGLGEPLHGPFEAVYVSTTRAGDWLDRVAAHGLGIRSAAQIGVHADGVLIVRAGAPDVWVPTASLVGVRRERGQAGKFADRDGVVVVTWRSGDEELDSGLRTRYEADRDRLVDAVQALVASKERTDA